jgi:hypothetical protein
LLLFRLLANNCKDASLRSEHVTFSQSCTGGAYIVLYVCATISLQDRDSSGAYIKSNVRDTRES